MSRANPRVVASARKMARQANGAASVPGPKRAVKRRQWQALKRSIVAAATSGAISPERASAMIARFGIRAL